MSPPARVCVFGTYDPSRHPRVLTLAEGLAAHGFEVVIANAPWDAPTHQRVRAVRDPWMAIRLLVRLVGCWLRLVGARRSAGRADVVLVGYLGLLDVHLARLLWPQATLVLDHLAPAGGTIDDRFYGASLRSWLARRLDRAATRRADVVVVDTDEHLPVDHDDGWVVVPVGAARRWFDAREADPRVGSTVRLIFFGLFTPLQGTVTLATAIARALDAGAAISVTMVGGGQDHDAVHAALRGRSAVTWIPWMDADELPRLVASHDVCLGIFGTTAKGLRVVPNKVFQGAAAGCAIVTSDTPPQRRLLGDAALLVAPGDPAALAATLVRIVADPDTLAAYRASAAILADGSFTPEVVSGELATRLRRLSAGD